MKGLARWPAGEVTLHFRHTKGNKPRIVRRRPEAVAILLRIPRSNASPYIF